MELIDYLWVTLAAVAAGLTNALAGGGTLFTFPTLTAVGLPAVAANITSTVALFPGYFGATVAQSKDLRDQVRRLWLFVPAGALGGLTGGILLLNTGERVFRELVPFLILIASLLLALQNPLRCLAQQAQRRQENGRSLRNLGSTNGIHGCHLWGVFRRRIKRHRAGSIGFDDRRQLNPIEWLKTGDCLRHKLRRGIPVCFLRPGSMERCPDHDGWGIIRRRSGWSSGRTHPTHSAAPDCGDSGFDCGCRLFHQIGTAFSASLHPHHAHGHDVHVHVPSLLQLPGGNPLFLWKSAVLYPLEDG